MIAANWRDLDTISILPMKLRKEIGFITEAGQCEILPGEVWNQQSFKAELKHPGA
jgi:hypothetical protein